MKYDDITNSISLAQTFNLRSLESLLANAVALKSWKYFRIYRLAIRFRQRVETLNLF